MAQVVGLVLFGITAGLGYLVSKARPHRALRQPSTEEFDAVAEPLGAVVGRHLPAVMGTTDLEDIAAAGVGVRDYIVAGPLIVPRVVDPGIPDLSEME